MRIISGEEAQSILEIDSALELIRDVYRMVEAGRAEVSHPAAMHMRGALDTNTAFKIKGAVLDDLGVAGFRLIGDADQRHGDGAAYCYLIDPRDATPFALVDEGWLHRVRTALTGLVAVAALAPEKPKRLALIGTGRIALEFVRHLDSVLPGLPLVLASRDGERAAQTAREWTRLTGRPVDAASSVAEAVRSTDVVVTLSDADATLFTVEDVQPGTLVCAMGGRREFGREVLDRSSRFIVDEVDFVCTAGNVASWIKEGSITRSEVEATVNETIGGVLTRGVRQPVPPGEIWLAVVQGMAACDIGLAKWCFDRLSAEEGRDAAR
jgi:ornithine cyclodeaminase/alanine dehydrogenase-like protein (mu-crystallin family)